jgi:beta-glucanase (GH16 family)
MKVLLAAVAWFVLGCTSAHAQDLALNQLATASSTEGGLSQYRPANANDGNSNTRWSSQFSVPQWWRVDLGSIRSINRVELNWEVAYASRYRIQTRTSPDNLWSTAATITITSAGLKTHTFASRSARYVRIYADAKATQWGVSLWDMRVCNNNTCGTATPPPPPQCSDGVNNDPSEDSLVDLADPGCTTAQDNSESPNPSSTGEPGPIAGQGYNRVFADEFNTLDRSTWCNKLHWESQPAANSQFVQDGILHLVRRRSQNFQNTTMSTEPMCGQANPKTFTTGYFEARMRWPGVRGSGPAFWMTSERSNGNPAYPSINPYCEQHGLSRAECLGSELDVFEGYGAHPNVFTGTLHRNSSGQYGEPNAKNNNGWQPQPFRLADNWHTYAAKWTPTEVTWYVDGRATHSRPTFDSTNQPMYIILSHWTTSWEPTNSIDSSTPDVMDVETDWVRVWQR